jgi:hypothetical protein
LAGSREAIPRHIALRRRRADDAQGRKQVGEYFYIGGEKNNGTYNVYQISVSSPASHYFLNRQDKVGHQIFTIDYTQTIGSTAERRSPFTAMGRMGV